MQYPGLSPPLRASTGQGSRPPSRHDQVKQPKKRSAPARSGASPKRKSAPPARPEPAPRYVVGVGASAGGLEALRALFAGLKQARYMAFVVVQHLAPQHRSRMVELIGHATSLTVKEAVDSEPLRAGVVYVTPPNKDAVAEDGTVRLLEPESRIGPKPSVDRFFRSLAEEYRDNAIAIVLSGTGTDGSRGIRDVKAAGGGTYIQSVASSKYDGMPRAARQTGTVDHELSPEDIAARLHKLDELAGHLPETATETGTAGTGDDPFESILASLKREAKVDFTRYKPSTLRRRIERRVVATRCRNFQEYAQRLAGSREEARLLFQDILISVTAFFRDAQSFRTLGEHLLGRIKRKPDSDGQPLRIWVVGCATGEEAYSIAILAYEVMARAQRSLHLQIFATDLDEQAMATARKGIYPRTSLADVEPALHARYFETADDDAVRVKDFVRDCIVFARHDVTQDPPFLKLDMVTCRNVLIYFNTRLQDQVLRTFHYALDSTGILFLGKSETTSASEGHFETADKNARLFVRAARRGDLPHSYSRSEVTREARLQTSDRENTVSRDLFHSMIGAFAPDSVLVDEGGRVRHIYGEANRFLNLPRGATTVALGKLLPDSVGAELATALLRAGKTQRIAKGSYKHRIGGVRAVQIWVTPLAHEGRRDFLVSFQQVTPESQRVAELDREVSRLPDADKVRRLQQELASTKDHLQTVIEEHETANEELQALNEELQSSNEELQSTNEELETTNEELQSANEELTTLNQEVNVKAQELQALNQRLQAVQGALFYPLLVVDRHLKLIEFNPAAKFLFRLTEVDRSQPLGHVTAQPDMQPALQLIGECVDKGRDGKLQFHAMGRHYETRVQIYRGSREEVEGAVVMLVDNSDLTLALQQSRLHQQRLDAILDNTPAIVTMKDTQGTYLYANQRFSQFFGIDAQQVAGRTDEDILPAAVAERMRDQDYDVIKSRRPMRFEDCFALGGRSLHWTSSKFALLDERKKVQSVCTIALDITERVESENQLQLFRQVVSASNVGIVVLEERGEAFIATFVSGEFAANVGIDVATLLGRNETVVLDALLRHCDGATAEQIRASLREQRFATFTLHSRTGGTDNWTELKTAGMNLDTGRGRYVVLTLFDVTEQHRLKREVQAQEEEFSRLSRLAAMGEVAAGLSHELNTPLNVISAKANLLERLAGRGQLDVPQVRKTADDIERTVKSIAAIISGLKALSGLGSVERRGNDLVSLVEEASRTCEFKMKRAGVVLELDLPATPVVVECIGVQIVQILVNLLTNSIDAVSNLSDRWIRISLASLDDRAEITVTDSGQGIDAHVAEKIMTPFFTTKKDRRGTGLGLSLSRTIARRHGGDLRLVAGADNTRFQFDLPLQAGAINASREAEPGGVA
jgi:two-component system CheB/CheR fusion protein